MLVNLFLHTFAKHLQFPDSKRIKSARIYSTGLGIYELYINGRKPIEDEYFLPSCINYELWLQYQTFDVTSLLQPNSNTIGILLGDGWPRGRFGAVSSAANFKRKTRGKGIDFATDCYEFLLELHLLFDDETTEIIFTDKSWKCYKSHILLSNIYDGEMQDMNFFKENWNLPDFDEKEWLDCNEINGHFHNLLVPRFSLPVVVKERIKPSKILKTPNGPKHNRLD